MFGLFRKNKKLGLALSGGAFRGWAHIGVLKVLEEEGVRIDYLAGTSMGAIIAAFYATGHSAEYIKKGFKKLSPLKIVDFDLSWQAMLSTKKIEKQLRKELGDLSLGQTNIPLRIMATDLKKGEAYVFKDSKVDLVRALCASSSIPVVFSPYKYNGKYLVDGCLTNNLPVGEVKQMGADIALGINLNPKQISREPKDLQTIFTWTNDIYDNSRMEGYYQQADMIISPISEYVNTFYFSDHLENKLFEAGEASMRANLPKLKKLLGT